MLSIQCLLMCVMHLSIGLPCIPACVLFQLANALFTWSCEQSHFILWIQYELLNMNVWIPKVAHIRTHLIFKLIILIYWLRHFILLILFLVNLILKTFSTQVPFFLNLYSSHIKQFLYHFYHVNHLSWYGLQNISSTVLFLCISLMHS